MIVDIGLKTKKNNPKIAIALPQKKYTERKAVKKKAKKPRQRPTLAQALQALPLATQRLTAEFGMGSGRTTASGSPG